jgi:hypothetical protein
MGTTAYENNLYIRKHIKYFFTGINKEEANAQSTYKPSLPLCRERRRF